MLTVPRQSALCASPSSSDSNDKDKTLHVMVNGMPGPMATAAAEACLRKGLALTNVAMTGPDIDPCTITVASGGRSSNVRLVPSTSTADLETAITKLKEKHGDANVIVIDFTHPSAVNGNAEFYVKNRLPFVMGTTGGDRDGLMRAVGGSSGEDASSDSTAKIDCVIAPNMGKQIVAMQAAMEWLAEEYPGAFAGYDLHVIESHQKTKADTSGTAKAVVDSLKQLSQNDDYAYVDINQVRDEEAAMATMGVPEDGLNGHAFHTYTFTSPDQSVQFQLQHNVVGRSVYAEGTADAVLFLHKQLTGRSPEARRTRVYNMIDVLQAGALQ